VDAAVAERRRGRAHAGESARRCRRSRRRADAPGACHFRPSAVRRRAGPVAPGRRKRRRLRAAARAADARARVDVGVRKTPADRVRRRRGWRLDRRSAVGVRRPRAPVSRRAIFLRRAGDSCVAGGRRCTQLRRALRHAGDAPRCARTPSRILRCHPLEVACIVTCPANQFAVRRPCWPTRRVVVTRGVPTGAVPTSPRGCLPSSDWQSGIHIV